MNPIDDKSTLVRVMAWCRQATSHYLSQWWPRSLPPYGVTRPQWVKGQFFVPWNECQGILLMEDNIGNKPLPEPVLTKMLYVLHHLNKMSYTSHSSNLISMTWDTSYNYCNYDISYLIPGTRFPNIIIPIEETITKQIRYDIYHVP